MKRTNLSESLEDYLEVIFGLEKTKKVARAKDIAHKMNVQRGSVTHALKNLEERGLINYEPYSFVTLTKKGESIAGDIFRRHNILKNLFKNILQLDEKTAESTACRMEHGIDDNALEKLLTFIDFVYKCPRTGEDWMNLFVSYCSVGKPTWEKCEQCIEACKVSHLKNGHQKPEQYPELQSGKFIPGKT